MDLVPLFLALVRAELAMLLMVEEEYTGSSLQVGKNKGS